MKHELGTPHLHFDPLHNGPSFLRKKTCWGSVESTLQFSWVAPQENCKVDLGKPSTDVVRRNSKRIRGSSYQKSVGVV